MNTLRKLFNYFSCYWVIVLYGSVLFVYFKIGKLPEFSRPDPKELIGSFSALFFLFNVNNFIIYIGLVLNVLYLLRYGLRKIDFSFSFSVVNICLKIVVFLADPFGYKEWFFD